MNRISLIQSLIKERGYNVYLEIGTYKGVSFLPVKSKIKVAVDPKIKISYFTRIKRHFNKRRGEKIYYFEMTSDKFFQRKKRFLEQNGPDIVLVDGLHTFEASLNDVLNSLKYLNDDGVIIMHDCYPPHKAAATPAESGTEARRIGVEGWTGTWCGDVWKTIVYLRERYPDILDVHVLNTDFGLGMIIPKKNCKTLELQVNEALYNRINKLDYDNLVSDPTGVIGLREIS